MKRLRLNVGLALSALEPEQIAQALEKDPNLQPLLAMCYQITWTDYIENREFEAYILSFCFSTPAEAARLALVCKRWSEAFKMKTFWRRFMNARLNASKLYRKSPELQKLVDPFHPFLWDKGVRYCVETEGVTFRGESAHKSPLLYMHISGPDNLCLQFVLGTLNTTLYYGQKFGNKFIGTRKGFSCEKETIEYGEFKIYNHYHIRSRINLNQKKIGTKLILKNNSNNTTILKPTNSSCKFKFYRFSGSVTLNDEYQFHGDGIYDEEKKHFYPTSGVIVDFKSGKSRIYNLNDATTCFKFWADKKFKEN